MKDYYQILGLKRSATKLEIKKSYRKLATKFHPDKNEGDIFFEDRFKEIQEAYEVLSNSNKKVSYDKKLDNFQNTKSNPTFNEKTSEPKREPKKEKPIKENKTQKRMLFFISLIIIISIIIYKKSENNISSNTKQQNDKDKNPVIEISEIEYTTFTNSLRGYKIEYPKNWKPKGQPPTNGDGRTFTDNQETELIVYSGINVFNTTLTEEFEKEIKNNEYNITYKIAKNNWYVISGFNTENKKEFYKKVYRSKKYDEQRTMILSYSIESHNAMQKIIPVLVKTFKDLE